MDQVKQIEARLDRRSGVETCDPQRRSTVASGLERRLANLTYDIEAARKLAMAKHHGRKAQLMTQLLELLSTGEDFTLRDLAAQLGTSYESVRRYRVELAGAGLLPA